MDRNTLLWLSFQINLIFSRLDFDKIFDFQIFLGILHLNQWIYLNIFAAQVLMKCKITFCKNLCLQHTARYQDQNPYPEELAGLFCCCHFQVPIPLWQVGWIKILWDGQKKDLKDDFSLDRICIFNWKAQKTNNWISVHLGVVKWFLLKCPTFKCSKYSKCPVFSI